MKNKFIALATLAIGLTTAAKAQNTSATNTEATANATIVTPISISKVADLNFGSIVKSGAGGTVTINPDGSVSTSGVSMFAGAGAVATAAAEFTISGESGYLYTISLPADDAVVLNDGSSHSMTVKSFSNNASGTFGATSETYQVGATLTVGANQAAGTYISDPFSVTVTYN
jgi:hypothetical protein